MDPFILPPRNRHTNTPNRTGRLLTVALIVLAMLVGALVVGAGRYAGQSDLSHAASTPPPAARPDALRFDMDGTSSMPAAELGAESPLTQGHSVADVAAFISPGVVYVSNLQWTLDNQGQPAALFERASGSGVIISQDGYIVTNAHVIRDAAKVSVVLSDRREFRAQIVGADTQSDLAVLKIMSPGDLTVAPLGDSSALRVGDPAIAIGSPLGFQLIGTVTVGVISAVERELDMGDGTGRTMRMLQTDAAINNGNSGGALVNIDGELVGINTLKTSFAGTDAYGTPISAEGIGFAIPINVARPIIEQLIAVGHVKRPWMGYSLRSVGAQEAEITGEPRGVRILGLYKDSPAERAGLRLNDIVLSIDNEPMLDAEAMGTWVQSHDPGQTLVFTIYRPSEERQMDIPVTLGDSMQEFSK